ncbi:MAG: hypothetical protein OEY89_09795 [Gammaproteobacteria bacterium]|nr:hypothetical protein [Gammaproteobacteria bacterium]
MNENSYVVRIYRRSQVIDADSGNVDAVNVTGKINDVTRDKWQTFNTKEELWKFITEQETTEET